MSIIAQVEGSGAAPPRVVPGNPVSKIAPLLAVALDEFRAPDSLSLNQEDFSRR